MNEKMKIKQIKKKVKKTILKIEKKLVKSDKYLRPPAILLGSSILGYAATMLFFMFLKQTGADISIMTMFLINCFITSIVAIYVAGDIYGCKEKPSPMGTL